jgi:hypothetical protein
MCKICDWLITESVKTELKIFVIMYMQKMYMHARKHTHTLTFTYVNIHQSAYTISRGQFLHLNELITLQSQWPVHNRWCGHNWCISLLCKIYLALTAHC